MKNKKEHGYILRYYLPVKPHFDEGYTKKRFDDLLDYCKKTKIGAVMFYVALDPNWYYMPASVEYEKSVLEQMKPYIKRLKSKGISYQLNFQNFLGAVHGGVDFTEKLGFEPIVDHMGNAQNGVACPIGKKFREKTAIRLKIWAETHPDIIWIDDDFRLHNHGASTLMKVQGKGTYADNYCFCDEHIRLFNEKNGTYLTRQQIVDEIVRSGEPSEIRLKYLDLLRDTMTETAKWVSGVVHGVDKNIKIAQMTSSMEAHSIENRDWKAFLTALSGEHKPVIRPHFGCYRETDPKDFLSCYNTLYKSMAMINSCYGEGVEYCPEIENTRFTTWTKSAKATAYQLGLSAFSGVKDTTLSIFDLDGGAFFDTPEYEKMLKGVKPTLDKLTSLNLNEYAPYGVICPLVSDAGKRYKFHDGDNYSAMGWKDKNIDRFFLQAGIPTVYAPFVLERKGTFMIDGYSANVLSDRELKHVLSNSVVIDGKGAETLIKRGFSDYLGVNLSSLQTSTVASEIIKTFTRVDGTYIRVPSRILPKGWNTFSYYDGVKVLSQFLSCDGRIENGLTCFKNSYGGKVLIYPAFNDWGDGFYNGYRLKLFKDALKDVNPDLDTILTDRYVLSAGRKKGDEKYYFIANLSTDPLKEIEINGKKIKTNLTTYGFAVIKYDGKKLKKKIEYND